MCHLFKLDKNKQDTASSKLKKKNGGTMPAKKFYPSFSVISKKKCNPYFIVIMIIVLIMIGIFWVVNFKTRNYISIFSTQNVYLRLSMYSCGIKISGTIVNVMI
jgi:multidrug resistance efflux pump